MGARFTRPLNAREGYWYALVFTLPIAFGLVASLV